MSDHDERDDPFAVEHDRAKHGPELPEQGPPVAQLASTYGSSFVTDREQAERIGEEATPGRTTAR